MHLAVVDAGCGEKCGGEVNLTDVFTRLATLPKATVKIPLACFVAQGADLTKVDSLFGIATDGPFAAAFTNIQIVGGAAGDKDALRCEEIQ